MADRHIYLDHAATTPIAPAVLSKMLPYMQDRYANPSSLYPSANAVRSDVEKARRSIKELIGGQDGNLIFTSGGTEANNWAIDGIVRAHDVRHIITSPLEHSSVLASIRMCQTKGVTCEYVPLRSDGGIHYEALEMLLKRCPNALVSLMHGNNEVGNMTDIARVASLCKQHGALLHSDMVQTLGYYPVDVTAWGVDICTGSAHKFYGPKGIGFLYVGEGIPIAPLLHGGQQERGLRAGTENVPGIIGMAHALLAMHEYQKKYRAHVQALKQYMAEKLAKTIPGIRFHGQCIDMKQSICTILNVGIPGVEKETFILQLAMRGIAASGGSACMSGSKTTSHVLHALGVPEQEAIVRFSLGLHSKYEDIDHVIHTLADIIHT